MIIKVFLSLFSRVVHQCVEGGPDPIFATFCSFSTRGVGRKYNIN